MKQILEPGKISWKGIEYTKDDFQRIHNISEDLLRLLNDFSRVRRDSREKLAKLAVEISYALARYAREVSDQAFVDAFQASVALQCFLNTGNETDQLRAKLHLDNVRKELCLDDLFGSTNEIKSDDQK